MTKGFLLTSEIEEAMVEKSGLPLGALVKGSRKTAIVALRHELYYRIVRFGRLSTQAWAKKRGVNPSSVLHGAARYAEQSGALSVTGYDLEKKRERQRRAAA